MQPGRTPVGWHLPPARGTVGSRSYRLEQHVFRSYSQGESKSTIAVIRIKPVLTGPQGHARRRLNRFMARTANLEKNLGLTLEKNLPVVNAAGEVHVPESPDQVLPV